MFCFVQRASHLAPGVAVRNLLMRVLASWCGLCAAPVLADPYLDELVRAADGMALHEDPFWQGLMHYRKPTALGVLRSLADDARFFNSPTGKTDPRAELAATLAAFFSGEAETDSTQNPQCRFIARYQWLKQRLAFDPARLPEQPCARYQAWRAKLDPERITLVFASAFLNNPGSAYGHTLLRIDRSGQEDDTSLLAYAISYAANTDDSNALLYGIKGLFGGYPGTYTMSPYYLKVAEYNDFENRDLWEYELDLTPAEIERVLMHVWELGPIHFDYYFFDENCAYQLLLLLDVARPSLALADQFPLWAIPADTARAVTQAPGLVRRTVYRPSRSTLLKARMQTLDNDELAFALRLSQVAPPPDPLTAESASAAILDLAFEYLDYRRERGDETGAAVAERLRTLLSARSRLDDDTRISVQPPAVRPDQGHRSGRVGITVGSLDGRGFQELSLRPAYHDLLDPQEGHLDGAQIDMFSTVLRHRNGDERVTLERFDLARVVSLPARDRILTPLSWSASLGAERLRKGDGSEGLRARVAALAGQTFVLSDCCAAHLLAGADFQGSRRLESAYALGPAAQAGVLADPGPRWRVGLSVRASRYALGDEHSLVEARFETRFMVTRDWSLRLEAGELRELGARATTLGLTLHRYF